MFGPPVRAKPWKPLTSQSSSRSRRQALAVARPASSSGTTFSRSFCSWPCSFLVHDFDRTFDDLKTGLSNGTIWALIALGYTLVYGIIELINFAHGEVFMLGSFVSVSIWQALGLTDTTSAATGILCIVAVLPLAMLAMGLLNVMIERVAYRPLRNAPKLAPLITAIGMSFILQNVGLLWRPTPDSSPDLIRSQVGYFDIFNTSIEHSDVFAVVVTVPLLVGLLWFVGVRSTARRCARPPRTWTRRA